MEYEANAVSDEVVGPRGQEVRHVQESTQLKRTTASFKSVLTRKRNEPLLNGADVDCVKNKTSELNRAFDNFKGAHELYRRVLLMSVVLRKLMSIFTPSIMLLVV